MSNHAVQAYATTKRFSAATRDRWLRCNIADQEALLRLAERLRLGENHLRDILDALEAIAARRHGTFATILNEEPVRRVLADGRARNETLHALKDALRRLRFPQLAATEARLRGLVKGLGLPKGAIITLPENLEGEDIVVTIRAASAQDLRRRIESTAQALGNAKVEEMYGVLGGDW